MLQYNTEAIKQTDCIETSYIKSLKRKSGRIRKETGKTEEFYIQYLTILTKVLTNSLKHCPHSSLDSGLCARRGHYAGI
jgi:hypothetical protein